MIALPVLAVTAADVVIPTSDVSGARGAGPPDRRAPTRWSPSSRAACRRAAGVRPRRRARAWRRRRRRRLPTVDGVAPLLGRDVAAVEIARGRGAGPTPKRRDVDVEVDRGRPASTRSPPGSFELDAGRLPARRGEVVVNQASLDSGYAGRRRRCELARTARDPTVVGIAESTTVPRLPDRRRARSAPSALEPAPAARPGWSTAAPVSWDDVRALNAIGATVAVARGRSTDPPPDSELPPEVRSSNAAPTTRTSRSSC